MEPPKKHVRKLITTLPPPRAFVWDSPYNKVSISSVELGNGASSRLID